MTGARASDAQRILRPTTRVPYPPLLDAVLYDWGNTLMQWASNPELLDAGHAAGLRALGREPAPALTARFRETAWLPRLLRPGTLEGIDYAAVVRGALAEAGIVVDDEELARFLDAEHSAWQPARMLASTTHALLDALRESGLRLGLLRLERDRSAVAPASRPRAAGRRRQARRRALCSPPR